MQETLDPVPWARAVIRDGRITLNPWKPGLMTGGPDRPILAGLRTTGTMIADLACPAPEELVVRWIPDGSQEGAAAETLLRWAERTGYTRVWLPDRVVDLGDSLFSGGRAEITCPTCRLEWDDESPDFWATVRSNGFFPATCPVCNGSLPEWELVQTPVRAEVAS